MPLHYEAVHEAPNFKGHLAHAGWPWVDECIAVLKIGARFLRIDPAEWGLKVDLSFGPPGDWQLETWRRVLDQPAARGALLLRERRLLAL